ncbi:GNAT family N-acetyltransferase [Amycolatopsis sp. H20-H5]|uniref:GNAT family N-acetyltransferase n=1 Tax=Amycolatopsis sp. H20-H5 TaxID=3046309 RepID=UPI002DB7247F|nr:GNAT family N-acetyltransferase [Amycolatopsis sp. H20-H5]MEC3980589.1 GNAT family N-acetyltransferase [Amycolatopsis sp. H20-H5]
MSRDDRPGDPAFRPASLGYRENKVVALAEVCFLEDENSEVGLIGISVHPDCRRRGIGTAMLRAALPESRARGCRVLESWQVVAGTAGQFWAEGRGFTTVRMIVRQALVVAGTDRSLWDVEAPAGYRLQRWIGVAPDDVIDSYAVARGAIHDAPLGQSDYRWPEWTVERVRAAEAEWRQQGIEQWVVIAIHEKTGAVAGFTEVCVHPRRPDWGYQRDTAVPSAFRGRGLGRCIKACMLRWLVSDCPALERISTTTGADNSRMIRVNREVGFASLRTMVAVQQDLVAVESRMADRDGPAKATQ